MQNHKTYLNQLQALCEFSRKSDVTGIDVEYIFQVMGEDKNDRIWEPHDARTYQDAVYKALHNLVMGTTGPGLRIDIKTPSDWVQLDNDGKRFRLSTRRTSGPQDMTAFRLINKLDDEKNNVMWEGRMPFLVYRAVELLSKLPPGALRICAADDCYNPFAAFHKTKRYCSPRCRNRMNTYATRRRKLQPPWLSAEKEANK